MLTREFLLCFVNPSLLVFELWRCCLLCWVGALVKGAGTQLPGLWTRREGWSVGLGRIWKMFVLICWLQSWLMWWMTQVIHCTVVSRVDWFLDLAACVCRMPWLADIFPPLFHRQSEFTMQTFREAQFPLICNLFFYSYLVCIFVSFHYVHNFQKWSSKVLLDLTWLVGEERDLYRALGFAVIAISGFVTILELWSYPLMLMDNK